MMKLVFNGVRYRFSMVKGKMAFLTPRWVDKRKVKDLLRTNQVSFKKVNSQSVGKKKRFLVS